MAVSSLVPESAAGGAPPELQRSPEVTLERSTAVAVKSDPPVETAGSPVSLTGSWRNPEGAIYEITQNGAEVTIREISSIFYVRFETATCTGPVRGVDLVASCVTYAGTTGELRLTAMGESRLDGEFVDFASGGRIPLQLSR